MGCDIHAHMEIKVKGKWLHYDQPRIDRNYHLFALMAGVRNHPSYGIDPILIPKGLPSDISETTLFCSDDFGEDGHSHSWLDGEDLLKTLEFAKKTHEHSFEFHNDWGYLFGNGYETIKKYPECYPKGLEDFRLVFWFDN